MSLKSWIESLLEPSKTNLDEAKLDDLLQALNEPGVRKHWVESMIEELRILNIKMDRLLEAEAVAEFPKISHRRNTIVFCLNQILDSKAVLDSRRFESERDNPAESVWNGVAVQRD